MLWRRTRSHSDFSSELQAHIDHEADRLRAEGLSEDEAYARARRTFGSVTLSEELCCKWSWMIC
jgi:macrolide transport system ATP-binding/permease protein